MSVFSEALDDYQELWQYIFKTDEEYKKLESLYKDSDSWYLLQKIKEYSKDKKKYYIQYFNLILFIYYYYENNTCKKDKNIEEIVKNIKLDLKNKIKNNDLEYYSTSLMALFTINEDDEKYYIKNYRNLDEKWYLYTDILPKFVKIFIKLWNKDLFIEAFKKLNLSEHYGWEIEWLDFLISFKKEEFNKYLLDFIEFFSKTENKEELIQHYQYYWIFSNKYNSHINSTIDNLLRKISKNRSKEIEVALFDFIKSEFDFCFKKHLDIKYISFTLKVVDYLLKKDKRLYLKLFSDIKFKAWSFEFADILSKYIIHWDEKTIFDILKSKNSLSFIVYLNDFIEKNRIRWWKKIIEKFKTYKEIKVLYKNRDKAQKNDLLRVKKSIEKEKKEIWDALKNIQDLRDKEWKFYYSPKLVYEFKNRQLEKNYDTRKKLNEIFTKKQYEKIEQEIFYSISNFFLSYEKLDYTWFYDNLEYNKLEWNTVSYPLIVLNGTVDMFLFTAFHLKVDLSIYKKFLIWFMPFLSLSKYDNIDDADYFKYIENSIDKTDIDYVLNVYSVERDLKDDLRYCQTENLFSFFSRFNSKFNKKQKESFYEILESFIFNEKLLGVYFNLKSLSLLKELSNKETYFKNLFENNYIDFNYFKDVLKNSRWLNEEELNKFKILAKINEILIEKYKYDLAIKWRIKQLKEWEIDVKDVLKITYPNRSSSVAWISEAYSEIYRFSRDKEWWFINVFKFINNEKYNWEFLDLLKQSFNLLLKIEKKELNEDFQWYVRYLQEAFFNFLSWFKPKQLKISFYNEIEDCISKFDTNIIYNFNISKLKKIFGEKDVKIIKTISDPKESDIKKVESILDEKREVELNYEKEKEKLLLENKKLENIILKLRQDLDNIKSSSISLEEDLQKSENILYSYNNDFVLFVEWDYDKLYLEYAYDLLIKIGEPSLKFTKPVIIPIWSAHAVHDHLKYYIKNWFLWQRKIIGMFDYDFNGVHEFNNLGKIKDKQIYVEKDINKCKCKQVDGKNIFYFMLPVPEILESNVYYDKSKDFYQDLWKESLLEIEHLFFNTHSGVDVYFIDNNHMWRIMKEFNNKKKEFYKFISDNLKKELFINFYPILEMIDKIMKIKI